MNQPVRVIIESPCAAASAGGLDRNLRYLRAALADCLQRGEAPFASHALYTQPGVLRDEDPAERATGIAAGFAWRPVAERTVVYGDLGISGGMRAGIEHAGSIGQPVEWRSLPGWAQPTGPPEEGGRMIFAGIDELTVLGTVAIGQRDERVRIEVREACNLGALILLPCNIADEGVEPVNHAAAFWFPDTEVDAGQLVVLFSKAGQNRRMKGPDGRTRHLYYWSRPDGSSVWREHVPVLVHIDALTYDKPRRSRRGT